MTWRQLAAAVLAAAPCAAPAGATARTADEIVAEVRRHTAHYLDIARARAAGFVQISGMERNHGYHFIDVNAQILSAAVGAAGGGLDLAQPPMLLYVESRGVWRLVGVEYALLTVPAVFVQHLAMAALALGVGAALIVARRRDGARRLGRAWPALLFVLALVLLFYAEA